MNNPVYYRLVMQGNSNVKNPLPELVEGRGIHEQRRRTISYQRTMPSVVN